MNRVFLSRAVVRSVVVLAAVILATTFPMATASGEVIVAYEPISGIVSPPSIVGANVSGSAMMCGPGLTPVQIPGQGFMSSGFTPVPSPLASEAAEDYVSWGFESTVPWDLAAMDIAYFNAALGPRAIHISLSVNGGPFEWVYMDQAVPQFPQRAEVTGIDLSTYTDVVHAEFRLYGWAAPDPNGLFSICPTTIFDGVNGLIVYGSYEPPVGPPESYWTNSAGGLFADAGNWSDGVPGPTTDTYFSLGGASYGVTLDADANCQYLFVHGDAVSMALNGHLLHSTGVEGNRWSISVTGWSGQTSRWTLTAGDVETELGVIVGGYGENGSGELILDENAHLEFTGYTEMVITSDTFTGHGLVRVEGGSQITMSSYGMGLWVGGNPANGNAGNGRVEVSGTDSRIDVGGDVYLGTWYGGSGTMLVELGGAVTAGTVEVGGNKMWASQPAYGSLTIDGGDSLLEALDVYIGGTSAHDSTGTGDVNVLDGGTLRVTSMIKVWGGGTLRVDDATVDGNVVLAGGQITPGSSAGIMTIDGDLEILDGTVVLDLEDASSYDVLSVSGSVTLAGDLDVELGYAPSPGDAFLTLENNGSGSIAGNFDGLSEGGIFSETFGGDRFVLRVSYLGGTGNDMVLTVLSPGDADGNGMVDDRDASILGAHWQQQLDATWAMGDFNDDGKVNDMDAAILAAHWHYGVGEASVPEPTTVVSLILGLLTAAAFATRRRR